MKTVQELSGGVHEFTVEETGTVSFVQPFFDGAGTSQLKLVGYSIVIDATAITPPGSFFIGGIGGFPSATVETLTFLPGDKTIQDGSGLLFDFEVLSGGSLDYDSGLEGILTGKGTSSLTFDPSFVP